MENSNCRVFDVLETIGSLPTLPVVISRLNALIGNPHTNMQEISEVIAKDQAISVRVIRLVNSAFYGFPNSIGSIRQAIVILGLNTVRNIILGVSVVKVFENGSAPSVFDRHKFWLHTFAVAMGAKLLAQKLGRPEPEDYFISGLLHDIGILVLDQFFHREFIDIIQNSLKDNTEYESAEINKLGVMHAEIGAFLAGKWKIPEFLINTIQYHHNPMEGGSQTDKNRNFIAITHLSDITARKRMFGAFVGHQKYVYNGEALRLTGANEQMLDEVFDRVEKEVSGLIKEWNL